MANPNIAALTEFYGGTLAWELTPTQPVFAFEQWSGYNMNNSKFRSGSEKYLHNNDWTAGSPAYIEYDWTIANSFQNRLFIFVAGATDSSGSEGTEIIGTTTAPTYNGTAMTGRDHSEDSRDLYFADNRPTKNRRRRKKGNRFTRRGKENKTMAIRDRRK